MCPWFSLSTRSYCLTLKVPEGRGRPGSIFFISCGSTGWGLRLRYNNHRCPISSPRPQSTVWPVLFTLCICARTVPISHLTFHPFDQPAQCTECEQIVPTLFPLCWSGRCVGEVPAWCTSVPLLKKVFLGATTAPSHLLAFHTVQFSAKSRVYMGHGQLQPTSSPSSRCHQDPPNSLVANSTVIPD